MYRRLPQVPSAPKGALKFTCKGADAVAYVWNETIRDGKTRYIAKVYFGKAGKPRVYAWYRTAEAREHAVSLAFKGAIVAAECLVDLTPPPPPKEERPLTVLRDRGAGRPTKRERRDLEKLRGR